MLGGGRQMAADRTEPTEPGSGAHAVGFFLSFFNNADVAFEAAAIRGHPQVAGKAQVAGLAVDEAAGQHVAGCYEFRAARAGLADPEWAAQRRRRVWVARSVRSIAMPVAAESIAGRCRATRASAVWVAQH